MGGFSQTAGGQPGTIGTGTGPDREVSISVLNGVGTIGGTGVDVEAILVSTTPCEARWDLGVGSVTLVQRFSVGTINVTRGAKIRLDTQAITRSSRPVSSDGILKYSENTVRMGNSRSRLANSIPGTSSGG